MEGQYAIYLRKSRADIEAEKLGEGETLARHKNILIKLAEKYEILPSQLTIYQEIVSGESIAVRPQMRNLLTDVYQKKYKGVLVVEIERLARGNTADQGEVVNAFQFSNTKIITPLKIYDPNNEFDQEYFEFGLFMSRREYKTIHRRMEAGKMESVAEGNYVGASRPFGYNIQKVNKKERILVPNEYEAPYVKMIFDWFTVDRYTVGQIARTLTSMNVTTIKGGKEWNTGTVRGILKNIHYTGNVRWFKSKQTKEYNVKSGKMQNRKVYQSVSDRMVYKGKHKAIITMEQYELAQSLFVGQTPLKINEVLVNPLAGLLLCKNCGKTMSYFDDHSRPNTAPRYAHKPSQVCKMKSCSAFTVIDAVCAGLESSIDDFEVAITKDKTEDEERREIYLKSIQSELTKLENRRKKLFDAFEDGAYTNAEFLERKEVVNKEIEKQKKLIEAEEDNSQVKEDYEEKIVTLHNAIMMIKDNSVDAKAKNEFLKSIIDRIEYDVKDLGKNHGSVPILDIYLK